MVDSVFPRETKRRLLARIIFSVLKNPWSILCKINLKRIHKLFRCIFMGDGFGLKEKLKLFFDLFEPCATKFKIYYPPASGKLNLLQFDKAENPQVSIIIPVYNQWLHTYCCLLSISENTKDISYEIIVADDVSTDETIKICDYAKNISVIRNQTNLGFLLNCNNAAKYANGRYIVFLNNDVNVQENWLKSLVDLIESDSKIGMVGSKLVYSNGRLQEAGGIIWSDAIGWIYGRMDDPNKPEYNYVKECDYISGASIMIKTDLWKQIGGFDERFVPAYYEDADLPSK